MSWEANHIYATPTPAVLDALCATEALQRGIFLVPGFGGYAWPEGVQPYDLPGNGLIVVREVQAGERRVIRWTEAEILSWRQLDGPEDAQVIPAARIVNDVYISRLTAPPTAFLRYLKHLSTTTNATVAYYHHEMVAGETDEEFAWVFGSEDMVYVYNGESSVYVHSPYGKPAVVAHSGVFGLLMRHFGLVMPHRYFPLHAVNFPWEQYRITCPEVARP